MFFNILHYDLFKEQLSFSYHLMHSIQRAAVWVLDQYYSDFPVYNPALLNLPKSILSKKMSAFKIYNLGEGKMILCTSFHLFHPAHFLIRTIVT